MKPGLDATRLHATDMSTPRYIWRQLTPKQREKVLAWRRDNTRPWHSPPHRRNYGLRYFLISAACYEHAHHIGLSPQRMERFSASILEVFQQHAACTVAWRVLPNHYHALVEAPNILKLLHELGRLHGRTSHAWNGEESTRGRQVFYHGTELFMRSERHFFATLNYGHNNPVHHGYVRLWTEWPWSSAADYLDHVGRPEAERVWKAYPIRDYGKKWDDPRIQAWSPAFRRCGTRKTNDSEKFITLEIAMARPAKAGTPNREIAPPFRVLSQGQAYCKTGLSTASCLESRPQAVRRTNRKAHDNSPLARNCARSTHYNRDSPTGGTTAALEALLVGILSLIGVSAMS